MITATFLLIYFYSGVKSDMRKLLVGDWAARILNRKNQNRIYIAMGNFIFCSEHGA
jgi:hypothetical protein